MLDTLFDFCCDNLGKFGIVFFVNLFGFFNFFGLFVFGFGRKQFVKFCFYAVKAGGNALFDFRRNDFGKFGIVFLVYLFGFFNLFGLFVFRNFVFFGGEKVCKFIEILFNAFESGRNTLFDFRRDDF